MFTKTDTGRLRSALFNTILTPGEAKTVTVFNDVHKSTNTRRLKAWLPKAMAGQSKDAVYVACHKEFGERLIDVLVSPNRTSVYVYLHDWTPVMPTLRVEAKWCKLMMKRGAFYRPEAHMSAKIVPNPDRGYVWPGAR
jgi:hypothetical protein